MRKLRTIEMGRMTVDEFKAAEKLPLIVVLDDVRSLHNVGSVFRSCDAFRTEAVYLCGITATPPSPEIHKTALGAEDSVRWQYFKTAQEAVEQLHNDGYCVYSIEQCEGSTMLHELDFEHLTLNFKHSPIQHSTSNTQHSSLQIPNSKFHTPHSKKYAVILGNEVKGVHQEVIDMSDGCLEIPQFGTKHSLNVSVTAGIVIWEFARRLIL